MYSRTEQERFETEWLATYAMHTGQSPGRRYAEAQHAYRSEFQRDRDRIIFCRSFRRLEYKTQVFVNGTADHYRTRLTHTMEMAAVGRTLARALRVNEDLTETIALAHDIGHSPFGHCGERALDELMVNDGGFDHNIQSCRWVEKLEPRYPAFPGLNLTWEVRAGLRKHLASIKGAELDGHPIGPFQFMEAQIADVADDITYHAHDVDDGLEAGLITEAQLDNLELWQKAKERAARQYTSIPEDRRLNATVRALLDLQVESIIQASEERLEKFQPTTAADVMQASERIVTFGDELSAMLEPYRAFLFQNLYWHPSVADANEEAVRMMRRLFLYYVEHPDTMGRKAQARLADEGLWRTVCDYISGMTDRYALEEYIRFGLETA